MDHLRHLRKLAVAALLGSLSAFSAWAQPAATGRLDFLKSHDSSYALLANTSATFQPGKQYPNELLLITGWPFAPVVSAHVDLGLGDPHCGPGEPCGRLRNLAISPDGDTALLTTDPSDVQTDAGRDVSVLVLLRNIRKFVQSKNKADLGIKLFKATEFPQLDNVSGLAFGPDGRWAVASTMGKGVIDLNYTTARGTLVPITGLPDNPQFGQPFPVPMHSQGNISISLDGGTLLLNDTSDRSTGVLRSNQFVVQGIAPGGGPPRVVATSSFPLPSTASDIITPVRDAKLTLDGRFVLAPIALIASFDNSGNPVGYNQFEILGPVRRGTLDSRILKESDGVTGGPFYCAVSPDGNTALIVNNLDLGGGELLTGIASGNPARFAIKPLPFPFFGPAIFPLGPSGPPVLTSHAAVVFTPDGKTALVGNWVIPPLGSSAAAPSITALTGFDTGKIQVAANLLDPILNAFDTNQQIATPPSGLLDYVNLYVPSGANRDSLTSLVNQAVAASDRGDAPGAIAEPLVRFVLAVADFGRRGVITLPQAVTLGTLAAVGIQRVTLPVTSFSAAGLTPGAVAPESIGALRGLDIRQTPQVTIIDSDGSEFNAGILGASVNGIDYLVPRGAAAGKAIAIVSTRDGVIGATTMEIEPVVPGLFTMADGAVPLAVVQRVKADGTQSYEAVQGPIDLGPETDRVFLLLFGTGISGGTGVRTATARAGNGDAEVAFAGPQGSSPGLDQVNVRLPRSLAGAGKVDITVKVDGWDTNTVTVSIR